MAESTEMKENEINWEEYRELSLQEHQRKTLEILKEVSDFCTAHQIRYYLAYGTLIGAIRHKGFIPWDDDIDIHVPRPDYDRLIALFNKSKHDKNLVAVTPNNSKSRFTFTKICDMDTLKIEHGINYEGRTPLGIDIDVFTLDGQPDDEVEYHKYFSKKHKLYLLHLILIHDGLNCGWKMKIASKSLQFVNFIAGGRIMKFLLCSIDKMNRLYPYEDSQYVGAAASLYNYKNDRVKRVYFETSISVTFEKHQFLAPNGYHQILTAYYDDYMQLPPEENRVSHHVNKIYVKKV